MSARPGGTSINSAGMLPQQILEYLSYPFASCFPSTSRQSTSNNNSHNERQGLLDESRYDDSDAISLLSNIADRFRRRSRSARRREEWRKRAAVVGCGLFGRPKGQIQRREVTSGDVPRSQQRHHRRNDSEESGGSVGVESEDDHDPPRSIASSLGGAQESGDEDAGMLGDEDIAELSNSKDINDEGEVAKQLVPTVRISEAEDSGEPSTGPPDRQPSEEEREAQERAALKARLDKEAEEYAKAQAEDAERFAAEEAALAAEEEEAAAVAKAKRKAERRAAKEELLGKQMANERARRRTEADAEAAAGGFDFAEEPEDLHPQYDQGRYEEYDQEADYQSPSLQQPEVVHHHHYYHEPAPPEEETFDDTLLSPNFRIQDLPTFPSQEKATEETPVEEDEDDADIAGLGFSKSKKNRSRGEGGGSNSFSAGGRSNGSGSGSWQSGSANGQARSRYEAHRQGSDHSAHRERVGGQSSSAGKRSYRDRPRKQHERTTSKSTGSGAGYTAREGIPHRRTSASPLSFEADEQRADAAAGGFDDFVPPPSAPAPPSSYRARERRGNADSNSASSQGRARERPRERRSSAQEHQGLNAPRNPRGANVFVQDRDDADIF